MQIAIVQTDIAPLYQTPHIHTTRIDEVLYGMAVTVLAVVGDMAKIRTSYRYEGYTPTACLCTQETAVTRWQRAPKAWVQKPYLDVLAQPRVQGEILHSVPRGALLQMQEAELCEGWQTVTLLNGTRGYVQQNALTPTAAAEKLPEDVLRKAVCESALSYLGTQYRWGGKTPLGIDCSGLTSMAYLVNGVALYRDAAIKTGFPLHEIPFANVKPADLWFFSGHVALSLGGGRFVHATAYPATNGVCIASLCSEDSGYRADLKASLYAAGSIF
ncbi:MAG: SH3 domain-containing C40 family peptidase [Ruthenibacterium sp.]